jgi:hypothetical protein
MCSEKKKIVNIITLFRDLSLNLCKNEYCNQVKAQMSGLNLNIPGKN